MRPGLDHLLLFRGLLLTGLILWIVALGYGIAAERLPISGKKGSFRTSSSILVAIGLCAISFAVIIFSYQGRRSMDGRIEQARVSGAGRSERTEVWVQPDAHAGLLALHASGTNPNFRPGERVALSYQEYNSSILRARFFSSSGKQEAAYNNPDIFWSILCVAVSVFIAFSAIRKQCRDPEGREQNHRQASGIDGSVDTRSLLRLSPATREDRET